MPCNLRVTRDWATQQNAAVDGAVPIAQDEAAPWDDGIAIKASAVAREAAAVHERREAEAAAWEAAAAPEARAARRPWPRKRRG